DQWHPFHSVGLDKRHSFKQLIHCSKAAWENTNCLGAHQKMHFAKRKIMEVEAEFRRYIFIGRLFMRQNNVKTNRRRTDIYCTSIASLHYARPTASDYDELPVIGSGRIF